MENSSALLGMLDIKVLNILRITYEVICNPHESRKFNSQTIEVSTSPSYRKNRALQNKRNKADAHNTNADMSDYFRSSTSRAVDKRASKVLINKILNKFSDVFQALAALKVHLVYM